MTKENTLLTDNIVEIIGKDELTKRLARGDKLRIKMGADPSSPDLHLGHAVALHKLQQFQALGHKVIFVIGDYTGRIGDPSGRNKTRPMLTEAEIKKNAKTYFKQVGLILDMSKVEIRYNSEWFKKMGLAEIIRLLSQFTVARTLERDDFNDRYKGSIDIRLHELLYPAMQAYDSVMLKADIEVGGTDQRFNMLAGRELQKKMGVPEQAVITIPLLVGLDGTQKMSKSLGNYIGLTDKANDMFGKVMSIPDKLIIPYFNYCTDVSDKTLSVFEKELKAGKNPRDIKAELAQLIVETYYDEETAEAAAAAFEKQFSKKEIPENIPVQNFQHKTIIEELKDLGFAKTNSEARRLLKGGAVKIIDQATGNQTVITDPHYINMGANSELLKVGKTRYVQIIYSDLIKIDDPKKGNK